MRTILLLIAFGCLNHASALIPASLELDTKYLRNEPLANNVVEYFTPKAQSFMIVNGLGTQFISCSTADEKETNYVKIMCIYDVKKGKCEDLKKLQKIIIGDTDARDNLFNYYMSVTVNCDGYIDKVYSENRAHQATKEVDNLLKLFREQQGRK